MPVSRLLDRSAARNESVVVAMAYRARPQSGPWRAESSRRLGWAPWLVCLVALALVAGPIRAQQPAAPVGALAGNVEHGRYLVERVAMCYECHSTRDAQGNIVEGTRFKGGSMPMRPPWRSDWPLQIPRIAGLPGYSDEEALRLLTQGAIKRDGTQARYPMPRFRMTQQDAADVIAFLRTL